MLLLDETNFISRGLHRECYQHPNNNELCIKVVVNGDDSETSRELRYYHHLQRRAISWRMLPQYYGPVDTNKGPGYQFEVVKDFTGEVSSTLEHYLLDEALTVLYFPQLIQALNALRDYLLINGIVTMTIKAKNILFRRLSENSGEMVVVDNIGSSDFIPICNYSTFFARRKTRRKWERFEALLEASYPNNRHISSLLNGLRNSL